MKEKNAIISLFVIVSILLITSCSDGKKKFKKQEVKEYPKYSLSVEDIIPDSSKVKYQQYILDWTKSASNDNVADMEDVVISIRNMAKVIYQQKELVLNVKYNDSNWDRILIRENDLSNEELIIFNNLKNSGESINK